MNVNLMVMVMLRHVDWLKVSSMWKCSLRKKGNKMLLNLQS